MSTVLKHGRFFDSHDDEHSAPVVVVDDVLASQYFPNQDPVGRLIRFNGAPAPVEIVGVVGHIVCNVKISRTDEVDHVAGGAAAVVDLHIRHDDEREG